MDLANYSYLMLTLLVPRICVGGSGWSGSFGLADIKLEVEGAAVTKDILLGERAERDPAGLLIESH
jgi:hypothetical protein